MNCIRFMMLSDILMFVQHGINKNYIFSLYGLSIVPEKAGNYQRSMQWGTLIRSGQVEGLGYIIRSVFQIDDITLESWTPSSLLKKINLVGQQTGFSSNKQATVRRLDGVRYYNLAYSVKDHGEAVMKSGV